MFFVNKVTRWRRLDFFLIHWAPTLIIFLAFIGVTLWNWQVAKDRARQDRQEVLSENLEQISDELKDRISSYENILRGAAGLFQASEAVTRSEWLAFIRRYDFENRYPDLSGIGYAQVIQPSELEQHIAQVRASDVKNYTIRPQGKRPIYTSILYAESRADNDSLPLALGQDRYTDPARKAVIDKAIETGQTTLTGKVFPAAVANDQPSIIMYFPIFKDQKKSSGTINDTSGFVQLGIDVEQMFNDIFRQLTHADTGLQVYIDGPTSEENILFQSDNYASIKSDSKSLSKIQKIALPNTDWNLAISGSESAGTPEVQDRPTSILIAGTLISLFMASFVYILLVSRTRTLAYREELEIQQAKDELLALASHQLRTPATGVKQYVGMLKQGYAGQLTKAQVDLIDKAYASNERQLNTINEMLSVARVDAGRLSIEPQRLDIGELARAIVEEQRTSIDERKQKITLSLPKQPVIAEVDPHYFQMAVDNIINNASKYTPDKGAIDVWLKRNKNTVTLAVADTGIGIPGRHYPMLFKKFSRIPNELSSQVSGTGIGLYLAKRIVEAHQGKLTFSSEPGVGSTFKIVLPSRIKRPGQ